MSAVPIESAENSMDEVEDELLGLVDAGLLMFGVSVAGEVVYWATEMGSSVLGMAT